MRQKQALAVMTSGRNVFLTGAPGAGKTYVLAQFVRRASDAGKTVAVTASTGIAASQLGGTTIHSWSGLGILDSLTHADIERLASNVTLVKRYNATDTLVIDEVSMLHGARLDMLNQVAKVLRSDDRPFGGMQIILVGDLFQLPPVSRLSREFDFAHLSPAWEELDLAVCYITEQHRQQANDWLLQLLEAMRSGDVDEQYLEHLRSRIQPAPDSETVTRLYAHNVDVESINTRKLAALDERPLTFQWYTKGAKAKLEQLSKGLLVGEALTLKIGAEVMFVANNFAEGWVNGTRGTVIDFENGDPVVQLLSGRIVEVQPHTWSLNEDGRVRAEVAQLPLRLAWAITIHKSQGMSLDAAEIDLGRTFTSGMGYVALSRVRSLEGLYLLGLNDMALRMHPGMQEFDEDLRRQSALLAETTSDIAEAVPRAAAVVDEALLGALKQWRQRRAGQDGIAPYMVAHNTTLEAVALNRPSSRQQLLSLPGFGIKKVDAYGPDILSLIADHA